MAASVSVAGYKKYLTNCCTVGCMSVCDGVCIPEKYRVVCGTRHGGVHHSMSTHYYLLMY